MVGYVFGKDAQGITAFYPALDTQSANSTGPSYITLFYPGTYRIHFQALINTTPCNLQPDRTQVVTITVYVSGGNNGNNIGGPGWSTRASSCNATPISPPARHAVASHLGWSMESDVTGKDGLVLRNVKLNGRLMAESISSATYYVLETGTMPKTRGDLRPNSAATSLRSRLIDYNEQRGAFTLSITAVYQVDMIPGSPESCLLIAQAYDFFAEGYGGRCEPSGELRCARWRPMVKYKFNGAGGEFLKSLTIPQRHHYTIDGYTENTVGLFRDCNYPGDCLPAGVGFAWKKNPLLSEFKSTVIFNGQDAGTVDNMHQTYKSSVEEPSLTIGLNPELHFISSGCPECVHDHWRWGAFQGPRFGNGRPLILSGSLQDLDIAVVRNHTGEESPVDYLSLIGTESLRKLLPPPNPLDRPVISMKPEDVVFWYSPTGHTPEDTFFPSPGFFNPSYKPEPAPITPSSSSGGGQNGPLSVTYDNLYEAGPTTYTNFDPAVVGPLPSGYVAVDNTGYDVATDSVVSGRHVITFKVPSLDNQEMFDEVRIFHAEMDSFNPARAMWVDRTILASDAPAPDFAGKTISARVDAVGPFVIGMRTATQSPAANVAELAVSSSGAPDPVNAGADLTYMLNVTNNGPQTATGIALINGLSPDVNFVSANSAQGSCDLADGSIYCRLDNLAAGGSTTVIIVVKPAEGRVRFPPQGKVVTNTAVVRAGEGDTNIDNNTSTVSTTVLPDPNAPPTVSITRPTMGELFSGPANITIDASASDSDGSISKLDYYDNGTLVGTSAGTATPQYSFAWNGVPYGNHTLVAVATDNLGKAVASDAVNIIVNGSATVNITDPAGGSLYNQPVDIIISAAAADTQRSISKVDFYADDDLIGAGTANDPGQYSFTWNGPAVGAHTLKAVATNDAGVKTTSEPVVLRVNAPPVVSLSSPATGTVFIAPASITLTANASDDGGFVDKVDFYANGALIGTQSNLASSVYGVTWNNPSVGTYSLKAVATDNLGVITISSPISIKINLPPTVSITAPASGGHVYSPDEPNRHGHRQRQRRCHQ